MKRRVFFSMVLVALLMRLNTAHADLANCIVLCRADDLLDKTQQKAVSKPIYDAYSGSDNSADDLVFIINIYGTYPKGGYSLGSAKLTLYGTWPIYGYEIQAADLEGVCSGIAEIEKAFADGRIYDLKTGHRDGPVEKPIYKERK